MSRKKSTTKRNKTLQTQPPEEVLPEDNFLEQIQDRERELSNKQLNAIDLLVLGKTDLEVGKTVGAHRVTVSKWRLYDPVFQAALNDRRAQMWHGSADRLNILLPKAIEILTKELENEHSPQRIPIAMALVKMGGISNRRIEPTRKEDIVRAQARILLVEEKIINENRLLVEAGLRARERSIHELENDVYGEASMIVENEEKRECELQLDPEKR